MIFQRWGIYAYDTHSHYMPTKTQPYIQGLGNSQKSKSNYFDISL